MSNGIEELKKVLENCFAGQRSATATWHESGPLFADHPAEPGLKALPALILREHYCNYQLWHMEDEARRRDVDDSVIADCKRRIDKYNQQRNDCMEEVDRCLCVVLQPMLPAKPLHKQNTETAGMAVDRLSILALKIYHMEEQTRRTDVDADHVRACGEKLDVLRRQRKDLARAVLELLDEYAEGRKVPVLYSQFKMYNDPALNPKLYGHKGSEAPK